MVRKGRAPDRAHHCRLAALRGNSLARAGQGVGYNKNVGTLGCLLALGTTIIEFTACRTRIERRPDVVEVHYNVDGGQPISCVLKTNLA